MSGARGTLDLLTPAQAVPRAGQLYGPRANTVVYFGDSITANGWTATATNIATLARGYATWAQVLTGHRLKMLANSGINGNRLPQMYDRLATDVFAYNPGWVVFLAGTNDIALSPSQSTLQGNYLRVLNALLDRGIKVIICTVPPGNSITAFQLRLQGTFNHWLKDLARTQPGVYLADLHATLVEPVAGGYSSSPLLTMDGIHPNTAGAARAGRKVAAVINAVVPPVDVLGLGSQNSASALEFESLTVNPYCTGTDGSVSSGVTGTSAHLMQITAGSGTVTAVASIVARTDLIAGNWQQVAVSASTGNVTVSQSSLIAAGSWTPGRTQIYAQCEFEADADWANVTQFRLGAIAKNAALANVGSAYDLNFAVGTDAYEAASMRPASGVLRTPVLLVPTTTDTRVQFQVDFGGTGTFRLGRIGLYKVLGT